MLAHFRAGFDELTGVQRTMTSLRLWDFLEQTTSYLSGVELGLYESTGKGVRRAGGTRNRAALGSVERGAVEENARTPARSHASAPVPRDPGRRSILCFLSHGPASRRAKRTGIRSRLKTASA